MWHEPGVVVVVSVVVVVELPPAGNGVVVVLVVLVVVVGGALGVGAVMVVEELEDVVAVVVGVVCASVSGTASAKLAAKAPAISNAFIGDPPETPAINRQGKNELPSHVEISGTARELGRFVPFAHAVGRMA